MKIEILGLGCAKCKMLEENARKAADSNGFKVEIVKVTDLDTIVTYGVMSTPALVIDGKVKCSGRIPEPSEITKWLKG